MENTQNGNEENSRRSLERLVRPLGGDIENGWNKTQLSKEEAIELSKSDRWKNWTDEEVFALQMFQERLCVDFSRFHGAVEKVLGRPVWTHEFADHERLVAEYEGRKPKATMQEIIELIPEEKRIALAV